MPGLFRRWLLATWAGWVLGIPIIVALALLGEAFGIGGSQGIVGLGAGAGVGLLQAGVIRTLLGRRWPWLWSCVVGLALPFLVTDLARWTDLEIPFSLPACVAAGGLLAGTWQAWLLHPRFRAAGWWIPASAAGWSLAGTTAWAADLLPRTQALRGLAGAAVYLGTAATGGLVVGAVTGLVLVRLRPRAGYSSPWK